MARIDDIERRLLNWARWCAGAGAGGLGYASVDMAAEAGGRDGYREAVIPTVDCEAAETHQAVMALPHELQVTVERYYIKGGGHEAKAERLHIAVSTMYARIDLAHRRIQAWLADLAATRRAQRERIERLQHAQRPGGMGGGGF